MLLMGTGKWKLLKRGRDCIKGSVFQHGQWFSVYSACFKCILSRQDMWKTWNMQEKKNRLVPVKENFVLCTFIFHALHQRLKKSALLVQMPYNRKHEFYFVYCFPVPDWVPKAIFGGIIAFFVVMSHLSMEASITLGQDMSSDRSGFSLFRFLLLKFGTQSL